MHCLAIVWYALKMVWYGMVRYALEMVCKGNGNSMHWQWYALEMVGIVWYGMHWYGLVLDTLAMVCKGNCKFMH
jgi:hypothetical protein